MREQLIAQQTFPDLDVRGFFQWIVDRVLGDALGWLWDALSSLIGWLNGHLVTVLDGPPTLVMILVFAIIAWFAGRWALAVMTFVTFALIDSMGYFSATMVTLAQVLIAAGFATLVGVPIGILAARSRVTSRVVRPVLDTMQTMPAFVYLVVAISLFSVGVPAGVVASFIFATPPAVRLTELGIRQVDAEVVEAARAFGASDRELLFQVQLPLARPTIMAGVNQVIMLSLSMVVIGGLAGAGGVAAEVVAGVTRLQVGRGLAAGLAVVILAIYLDRVTSAFGAPLDTQRSGTA